MPRQSRAALPTRPGAPAGCTGSVDRARSHPAYDQRDSQRYIQRSRQPQRRTRLCLADRRTTGAQQAPPMQTVLHDHPRHSGAGEPRMGRPASARRAALPAGGAAGGCIAGGAPGGRRGRRVHSGRRSRRAARPAAPREADADPVEKAASLTFSSSTAVRGLARRGEDRERPIPDGKTALPLSSSPAAGGLPARGASRFKRRGSGGRGPVLPSGAEGRGRRPRHRCCVTEFRWRHH